MPLEGISIPGGLVKAYQEVRGIRGEAGGARPLEEYRCKSMITVGRTDGRANCLLVPCNMFFFRYFAPRVFCRLETPGLEKTHPDRA